MTRLSESYNRIRNRTSNIGMIVIGIFLVLVSFFIRSDIFEAILDVVGLIGIIAGLIATGAGIYMLGDEKGWWDRLRAGDRAEPRARLIVSPVLFLLMLAFLALPWLSIKCENEDVVTVTGLDMVTLEEKVVRTPAGRDTLAPEVTDAILVYVTSVIAVAGAALLFVPMNRDHKRYTRAALGGLGVLALGGFVVQMMLRVASEAEGLASVSLEYGYYLSMAAFIAAVVLQFVPMPVPTPQSGDAAESAPPIDIT